MKVFKEAAILTVLVSAFIQPATSFAAENDAVDKLQACDGEAPIDATKRTPCPFLNHLILTGQIGPIETNVEELVRVAKKYGVNSRLMNTLASAVAESGESKRILLSDLLNPDKRPAHLGSLARRDRELDTVDLTRLELLSDYATSGRISLNQLHQYQAACWHMSDMGFVDRAISNGEVQLLWSLFGAYRETEQSGEQTIPVEIVFNFLKSNTLPESFKVNQDDPVGVGGLIWAIISNVLHR